MKDYYSDYEEFAEQIKLACECISSYRCSSLNEEIMATRDNLNNLNINEAVWGDSVADGFVKLKNAFITNINNVINSVSSSFTESEEIYMKLQQELADLQKNNIKYSERYKEEPKESDYRHRELVKGIGYYLLGTKEYKDVFDKKEYDAAVESWHNDIKIIGGRCDSLIAEIEANKNKLNGINDIKISITDINTSLNTSISDFEEILVTNGKTTLDNVELYLNTITGEIITLPAGLGNLHTYMGWQKVTNKSSNQYKLREAAGMNFDSEGFAKIGDRYVIATTTTYGKVGDYVDIYQADGTVIKAKIGDIKNQNDKGCTKWGHNNGRCVVEFVVDCNSWYTSSWKSGNHANPGTASCHPEWNQNIIKVENKGNYFDLITV